MELDYDKDVMRLFEPREFQYEARGLVVPFDLVNGIPFVYLQVLLPNGKWARGNFLVDTGGNMVVHIHRQVADREGLQAGLPTLKETGYGIGGGTTQRLAARGTLLVMEQYQFPGPVVVFTEDTAGLRANPDSMGLLGMEVLRRLKLLLIIRVVGCTWNLIVASVSHSFTMLAG